MNYRGLGFLAVVLFGSFFLPSTLSLQQVVSLSLIEITGGRGGRKGRGRRSKKAWSSIIH
jgi:hypothetical protein